MRWVSGLRYAVGVWIGDVKVSPRTAELVGEGKIVGVIE